MFLFPYLSGKRITWPQLLGKPAAEAKATIERDLPNVTAVIVPEYYIHSEDFCCNRVFVFVKNNPQRTVSRVPVVG
ncbi:hypothetical protein MKW94_030280 [Papaver nudicaule]|uniref:Uncharacterized protein n=1 Tax=Papaver nudicaule TaxID=74823 RepID=A0AA41V1G1_PAPNU|nr:hypothetical protein [Papaver nudicaule]